MSILFTENNFFKLSGETETKFLGYDLLTEEFVQIDKDKCTQLDDRILKVIGDEDFRIKLAHAATNKKISKTAKLINLAGRTTQRKIYKIFYNIDTYKKSDIKPAQQLRNLKLKQIKKVA